MAPGQNTFVTPEAVALDVDIAELGSRVGAFAIDLAVQTGIWIAVAIVIGFSGSLGLMGSSFPGVAMLVSALVIFWGYYPLLEQLWDGRTLGKRALGLRVLRTDGQPRTLGGVLVREFLRPIDMLIIGPVLIVTSRRHQRLGDMAGGTLVVREGRAATPSPVTLHYPPNPMLPVLDTAGLTQQEYSLIRSFLERRTSLEPGPRAQLAAQLAGIVRAKVQGSDAYASGSWGPYGMHPAAADEALLEAAMIAVRGRYQDPAPGG